MPAALTSEAPGHSSARPVAQLSSGGLCAELDCGKFHLTACGVEFRARWPIQVGTDLAIEFDRFSEQPAADAPRAASRRIRAEGIVLDCEVVPETCGCFKVTLLFLDLPLADRLKLNGISRIIAQAAED